MTFDRLFTDPLAVFDDLAGALQDRSHLEGTHCAVQEYREIIVSYDNETRPHLVYNYIRHLVDDVYRLR